MARLDIKTIVDMFIPLILMLTVSPILTELVAGSGLTGIQASLAGVIVLVLVVGVVLGLAYFITNNEGARERARAFKERARRIVEEED